MEFELSPQTPAGERFVKLAEEHARFIAERADEHDRDGTFPYEAFEAMHDSGLMKATVPEELGGQGLVSLRDLAIGISRLGRGDGAVALGANLHLCTTWRVARNWQASAMTGLDTSGTGGLLESIMRGQTITAVATELGTDIRHPLAVLTRVEGAWELSGRKSLGTLAPIADVFFVLCRAIEATGESAAHWAVVPKHASGVHVLENWDAMGLRALGSHDLVFDRVLLRDEQVMPPMPWGEDDALSIIAALTGNLGMVATFMGIAERAHQLALRTAQTRIEGPSARPLSERPGVQWAIAQNEIDLVTARSLLDRTGTIIDELVTEPLEAPSLRELRGLSAQFQAAKFAINERAVDIVERSMVVAGTTGYLSSHPLSRLHRDVSIGPLLQPYPPTEVHEYIGKVALGLDPVIQT